MKTVLIIILGIVMAVVASFIVVLAITILKLLLWFYRRKCKYCSHTMSYKGLREDNGNGHYLFHCGKCGSWEQVSRERLYHWMSNDKLQSDSQK